MKRGRACVAVSAIVAAALAAPLWFAGTAGAVVDVAGWHFADLSAFGIPAQPAEEQPPGTEMRYSNGWGSDWFRFGLQQGTTENLGPLTLAVRDNGETYVLDTVKRRVMVFRPDGTIWRTFHADTERAAGIAATSDGYVFLDNFDKNRSATVYGPDGNLVDGLALPADLLVSGIKANGTQVWVRGLVKERAAEGVLSDYVLVWEHGAPTAPQIRSALMPSGPGGAAVDVRQDPDGRLSYEFETGGGVLRGVLPESDDHGACDWAVTTSGDLVVVAGRTGVPSLGWDVWKVTPAGVAQGPEHVDSSEWTVMSRPVAVAADGSLYLLSSRQDGVTIARVRIAWSDGTGPLRPLTYGTGANGSPVVDGDWAAWVTWEGDRTQVYACRLPQGSPFPVGEPYASVEELQLNEGRIVWSARDGGGTQIYLFDTATGVTRKLTEGAVDHRSPRLSGGRIMWIEDSGAGPDARLVVFDLGTDSLSELAHGYFAGVQIDGDHAVWCLASDESPDAVRIYLHDFTTGSTAEIPSDSDFNQDPQVADGLVAWRGYPPDAAQDEIYAYSIDSGTTTRLTHDDFEKYDAVPDGGRVAWMAYDRKGTEIYVWDATSGVTSRLTYDPYSKGRPQLDGDWIAWERGSSSSRSAVFLHHLPSNTTLTVAAPLRDIYQPDNRLPSLSAGHLVWGSTAAGSNVLLYSFDADLAPTPDPQPFPDIPSSPYREAIDALAARGVVGGANDGLFHPEALVNRAQFAKMLVLLLEIPVVSGTEVPFWDIGADDAGQPYPYQYVAAAYDAGIVRGTSAHSYAPWRPISRAQLVTLIVRAADQRQISLASWLPPEFHPTLGDFDPTHAQAMSRAEIDGLLSDLPDFGPGWDPWAPATRGEAASLLRNLLWNWTN